MGLLSSIASIFGANQKKEAVSKATTAQLNANTQQMGAINTGATNALTALQTGATGATGVLGDQMGSNSDLIAQLMASFQPYQASGVNALTGRDDLLGTNGGTAQDDAIARLSASPFYQRLLGAGQNGILANASATGGLRGGDVQRSLADFSTDLLGSTVNNQIGVLGGAASTGLNATGSAATAGLNGAQLNTGIAGDISGVLQNLGINTANLSETQAQQLASLFGDQGAIKAGGIIGKTNAQAEINKGVVKAAGSAADLWFPGASKFI